MSSGPEHRVLCDVCGFDYPASETKMRWDKARVCMKDWEPRHPQDSVRAKRDRQAVRNARPEPPDVFLAPGDVTGDDL